MHRRLLDEFGGGVYFEHYNVGEHNKPFVYDVEDMLKSASLIRKKFNSKNHMKGLEHVFQKKDKS